ncbi:thioredoxin domain-containing protein [Pseudazoarcus pumilus]|uniref:Thioredoxin domain-containing protein n=1 Tax=Pseudazoarcus pumilus TaxID=2067960 RepID=A0A2I6S3U4_9RHOO|nr:thioredoxin domain-containing protein [Pseudazoarcus pumilus]AUN93930.1 thioredoxin domain-containing protein [Pseudazoarcus pumilus]
MPNRLASETSPYLLQHADNPVDWWPWCDEALALARERDLPILLSIGYSACHWCHVMAHECFADEEVAALMNRHFINIKVDREERPDLDHIYQSAHQLLAGRPGGWPLTVFLTPDTVPFFAGTYFPKTARARLPGFMDLLRDIAQSFATQRTDIEAQNAQLREHLARACAPPASDGIPAAQGVSDGLRKALGELWDKRNGGFGDAPKFPRTPDLEFLLYRQRTCGDDAAGRMVLTTLTAMAEGGLFDQIGGGFFRYSTDARWEIPHFEKMLYDNGPLLGLYADAWALTGEPLYRQVVEATAQWALREMRAPHGAFFAALDADSQGEEGRFYVWQREQLHEHVPPAALRLAERHWGVSGGLWGLGAQPNFEGRAWHLRVAEPLARAAKKLGLDEEVARALLEQARAALLEARETRVRPGRDEKILTASNALMIGGLARAARIFGCADWLAAAREALTCVRTQLWRDGRLLAVSDGGAGRLHAYLDDHAFLLAALLDVLQADFAPDDLDFACALADALLESFEDVEAGGFFFTRHDHERLIARPKPAIDNATASGNGIAARALLRLGHLAGELRYVEAAARALQAFGGLLARAPVGCASLALALAEHEVPPAVLVLGGSDADRWRRRLQRIFAPELLCVAPCDGAGRLPAVLKKPDDGRAAAWLCQGAQCEAPQYDIDALEARIRNSVLRG